MNATLNKHRLNNLIRGIQTSVALFESQGHENVYFTAHFYRGGRKQNSIERGDIQSFAKQLRTYISSEEAESARVEFFNEQSGKSIYVKVMSDLRLREQVANETATQQQQNGLGGYAGLGEAQVNQVVDRRVAELRKADEFERLGKEVEELRAKNERLLDQNDELEATIKAKSQIEFYTGIIGAAFPGLATLLTGTPLAQAANFLAGTSTNAEPSMTGSADEPRDSDSISDLIGEFCTTLNKQELAAIHLLFVAFESDRTKIQTALQVVSAAASTATAA